MARQMRAAQGPRPARKAKAAPLVVVPYNTKNIPEPHRMCDGGWMVPSWWPDKGWSMNEVWDDTPRVMVSRAQCGDPKCDTLHIEEHAAWTARQVRRRARAKAARQNARQAAQEARS